MTVHIPVWRRFGAMALAAFLITAAALPARASSAKLDMAYLPIMPMAQLFVMQGEGWLEEAGIELNLTRFSSGPAIVQALGGGKYDLAYIGIGPAMVARASGQDVKVIAANGIEQIGLLARGALAEAFAAAKTPAEAFKTFRDKTGRPAKIATLPKGSVPDTVLRHYLLKVAKVDMADVEILGLGASRVQQALLSQAVDGSSILEPILTVVLERDPTAELVALGGEMLPNQPGAVVLARERTIAAHEAEIAKLVELHIRATELINRDPKRAATHVQAAIGKGLLPLSTVETAIQSATSKFIADPSAIQAATKVMHDFQAEIGTLKRPVPLEELFAPGFYDAATKN